MDWSKVNDRGYLEGLSIGEMAQDVLKVLIEQGVSCGIITPNDIEDFKTEAWTKKTFGVYGALLSDKEKDSKGYRRYYASEIICYNEKLFLIKEWKRENKEKLIDWILSFLSRVGVWLINGSALVNNVAIPKVIKGPKQKPIYNLDYGRDEDCNWVHYNENIEDNEKIPELCKKLHVEYCEFVYNFARDILNQLFGGDFPEPIQVELCKECPSKIYLFNGEYIAKKINELVINGTMVDAKSAEKITRRCMPINGQFIDAPTPKIKIYYNQFDADNMDDYMAKISQTLAHEFLHYLEFAYCRTKNGGYYQDERVSEALADFFGVVYSLKRADDLNSRGCCGKYRVKVAKDRYELWRELEGSGWPYAHALNFYMVNGVNWDFSPSFTDHKVRGNICKFIEVFRATPNAKKALDILKHY